MQEPEPPYGPPPDMEPPSMRPDDRRGGRRPPPRSIARVPPNDIDAERAVLGSVMIDNEAAYTALEDLDVDDFYHPGHRTVFSAMIELTTQNQPVDAVTLSALLRTSGGLEQVGGLAFLAELGEAVPTAANMKHYAEIVAKKSRARKLIRACTESVELAFETANPDD
ncbi:MAG: DnaB-like helicase N-terminal domain-containing protein, partial [Myxococcota bacterium]